MKRNVFLSLIAFLTLCFIISSCKKEVTKFSGQVQFTVSSLKSSFKSAVSDSILTFVLFTIEDASGKVVKNVEKVELYNMNGDYISKPVSLVKGSYKLTSFMVLDSKNNVIYASPLKGSSKAYLVEEPMPISFDIQRNVITKLTPEVVSTIGSKPEDFGYVTFGFDIVKTFDFLIGTFIYNDIIKNYELTTASISIFSDTIPIYNGELKALQNNASSIVSVYDSIGITNKISLSERYNNYTLVIAKVGYKIYRKTFTKEELKLYFKSTDKGPLIVVLDKLTLENGLVAYYPFNGNAKDESGNGHHGTVSGALLTSDRNGMANKAYSFTGSNSNINVSDFGNYVPTSEISVSMWAQTVTSRSAIALCLGGNDSRFGISINYSHNGVNSIFWDFGWQGAGGDASGRLYQLGTPFDQNWHHYVFISSVSENFMKIYKDGVLVNSKNAPLTLLNPATKYLRLGGDSAVGYYNGALDEIRIYNRILTEGEILNLYQQ